MAFFYSAEQKNQVQEELRNTLLWRNEWRSIPAEFGPATAFEPVLQVGGEDDVNLHAGGAIEFV